MSKHRYKREETLTKSYISKEELVSIISKVDSKDITACSFDEEEDAVYLNLSLDSKINKDTWIEFLAKFSQLIEKLGWYINHAVYKSPYEATVLYPIIGMQIFNKDLPKKLYHIAKSEFIDNILNEGIKPKGYQRQRGYSPRIYLCTNLNVAKGIAKYGFKMDKFIVLSIDMNKLKNAKFYHDPEVNDYEGVYTFDTVPVDAIKVVYKS